MVKYTGRGLVVKRPGVLSKVQMLNLVLGVGVFSLLPIPGGFKCEFGGGNQVGKKSASMRKLKLRELNAESCVD